MPVGENKDALFCLSGTFIANERVEEIKKEEREKVWEMAGKLFLSTDYVGMSYDELEDCFGTRSITAVLKTPVDKVLEKYEAWKKENSVKDLIKSLKPQDVIAVSDYFCFCSSETKRIFMITKIEIASNGMTTISGFDKTGSHVLFAKQYNEYKGLEKIGRVVETTDILGEIKKIEDEWRKNRCGS